MSNIKTIQIGRVYNLGNYEHVRYEITAEVEPGEDPSQVMIGLEKVIEGLRPVKGVKSAQELNRSRMEVEKMRTMSDAEWERSYGHYTGTRPEIIERYHVSYCKEVAARAEAITRANGARKMLSNLNGAAIWKDAKLDWEDGGWDDREE
jgi:hypothetical protein